MLLRAVCVIGLLVLCLQISLAQDVPPTVRDVVIRGTVNLTANELDPLRQALKTKVGQPYNKTTSQDDVETLNDTGWFLRVSAATETVADGVRVVFTVVENPIIQEVVFNGLTAFNSAILRQAITSKAGQVLNRKTVLHDAMTVKDCCKRLGYTLNEITDLTLENGKLVFTLLEARVGAITFTGAGAVEESLLRRRLLLHAGNVYNERLLRDSLARLEALGVYKSATATLKAGTAPATVDIPITLTARPAGLRIAPPFLLPAPRLKVRDFEITGFKALSFAQQAEVRQAFRLTPGTYDDMEILDACLRMVESGWIVNFELKGEPVPDGDGYRLTITLEESPTVNEFVMAGNTTVPSRTLLTQMTTKPRAIINRLAVATDVDRLRAYYAAHTKTPMIVANVWLDDEARLNFEILELPAPGAPAPMSQEAPVLLPFTEKERWGYRDEQGQVVVPATYDAAEPFAAGLARVGVKGAQSVRYGYVDGAGKVIVAPLFRTAAPAYREGLAWVGCWDGKALNCGYLDTAGRLAIPTRFTAVSDFSEGLAAVNVGGFNITNVDATHAAGGKWGYIDRTGAFVIPAQYDAACEFQQGIAIVRQGGALVCIDRIGKVVPTPK